jgi:predicted RNA-binding protein
MMCLAKLYRIRDRREELLLEDVARVEVAGSILRFSTLFGEEREIEATVRVIDFERSSLIVEKRAARTGSGAS